MAAGGTRDEFGPRPRRYEWAAGSTFGATRSTPSSSASPRRCVTSIQPLLRIMPPPGIGAGPVDVQVRVRVGARELTERRTSHANVIELQLPPRWLTPGDYTATLTSAQVAPGGAAGAAGLAPAAVTLGFTVGAPSAADAARH